MQEMRVRVEGMYPEKVQEMTARVIDLVTNETAPDVPIDLLHIIVTAELPLSPDVQQVVDLLEAHSTPDTIITVEDAHASE
jgi:hypothetical protein